MAMTRSSRPSRRSNGSTCAGIGRSPSRFDFAKLDNLNGHYMREADDARLAQDVAERLGVADAAAIDRLRRGMPGLKGRAKTLKELAENAQLYVTARPLQTPNPKTPKPHRYTNDDIKVK